MRGALSEQVTLTLPPDFRGKLNRESGDGFAAKKRKGQKKDGRGGDRGAEKRRGERSAYNDLFRSDG